MLDGLVVGDLDQPPKEKKCNFFLTSNPWRPPRRPLDIRNPLLRKGLCFGIVSRRHANIAAKFF